MNCGGDAYVVLYIVETRRKRKSDLFPPVFKP